MAIIRGAVQFSQSSAKVLAPWEGGQGESPTLKLASSFYSLPGRWWQRQSPYQR